MDQPDAPVVISRSVMPVQILLENGITVIDPGNEAGTTGPIAYQLGDLDKDGVWDELFLMLSFGPDEHRTIYIYPNTPTGNVLPLGAYATLASYEHHLVPWWESEFMGWKRWYMDSVDMYAKRGTPESRPDGRSQLNSKRLRWIPAFAGMTALVCASVFIPKKCL